jgi:hypothetical protein
MLDCKYCGKSGLLPSLLREYDGHCTLQCQTMTENLRLKAVIAEQELALRLGSAGVLQARVDRLKAAIWEWRQKSDAATGWDSDKKHLAAADELWAALVEVSRAEEDEREEVESRR